MYYTFFINHPYLIIWIDILAKADALSAIQVEKVNKLIASNDQTVSRTFAEYETNKDLNALISSLKSLQIPSPKTIYKLSQSNRNNF